DIVVPSPQNFLAYYEAFKSDPVNSLMYLYDVDKSIEYVGSDTGDRVYKSLKPYTGARIEPFDEYLASHKHFFMAVMGDVAGIQEWQFHYLLRNSPQSLKWMGKSGPFDIYSVDLTNRL